MPGTGAASRNVIDREYPTRRREAQLATRAALRCNLAQCRGGEFISSRLARKSPTHHTHHTHPTHPTHPTQRFVRSNRRRVRPPPIMPRGVRVPGRPARWHLLPAGAASAAGDYSGRPRSRPRRRRTRPVRQERSASGPPLASRAVGSAPLPAPGTRSGSTASLWTG